jgi:hypothetical protein
MGVDVKPLLEKIFSVRTKENLFTLPHQYSIKND